VSHLGHSSCVCHGGATATGLDEHRSGPQGATQAAAPLANQAFVQRAVIPAALNTHIPSGYVSNLKAVPILSKNQSVELPWQATPSGDQEGYDRGE
jgi:hypothetical protein